MPRLHQDESRRAAERPHMRFIIVERYADNGELSHRALIDTTDGREVGTDGGEPEDASFWRDWAWVPDELNKHDAALRRAKAEGLEQVSELRKALELYRDASYQGHSSHWDKTGGSGSGCPACLRAIELRAQARQIVDTLDARAAQIEEGSNEI